jgi:nucleotide-binding universal stress UspA family protein
MHPFRTVLFAADFSENSRAAFRMACSLAVENKTRLIVLHVVEPGSSFLAAGAGEDHHQAALRKMGEIYTPGHPIDVEYWTREGSPSAEILHIARELGSDLIVVGTHGRTGLRRLLAGSVATRVLHGTHCPVLALRSHDGPQPAGDVQIILHPTDFSDASDAALSVARWLARDLGARLVVLHVIPIEVVMDGSIVAESNTAVYRDALERIRERLDGPDLKYPVETRVSRGFAADEIIREASKIGCDLIVMGTHGRTGLRRLLMGCVAESVLSKADCPLMVVRASKGVPLSTPARSEHDSVIVF